MTDLGTWVRRRWWLVVLLGAAAGVALGVIWWAWGAGAVSIAIAVGAMVVAALGYWRQVVWSRQTADAQTRLTAIEAARDEARAIERGSAHLTVRYVKEPRGRHLDSYLVVENYGDAPARDVTLDLVSRDAAPPPTLVLSPFPATIGARSEVRLLADPAMYDAAYCDAVLRWSDGAGSHEERLVVATL